MSETLRILALIGPITVATGLTALVASGSWPAPAWRPP